MCVGGGGGGGGGRQGEGWSPCQQSSEFDSLSKLKCFEVFWSSHLELLFSPFLVNVLCIIIMFLCVCIILCGRIQVYI